MLIYDRKMVKLFIIIKRRGSKRFSGAIPVKKGVSRAKLKKSIRNRIKKGFSFKIVTDSQLKRIIERQIPKRSIKRLRGKKRRKGKFMKRRKRMKRKKRRIKRKRRKSPSKKRKTRRR